VELAYIVFLSYAIDCIYLLAESWNDKPINQSWLCERKLPVVLRKLKFCLL